MALGSARPRPVVFASLLAILLALGALLAVAPGTAARDHRPDPVRFATFNASLNRNAAGQALGDLSAPFDPAETDVPLRNRRAQAAAVAEIIQRVRPDVLLVNEFDYVDGPVTGNDLTAAFQDNYLGVSQNGQEPISYPYVFVAPSNTGVHSGFDLNNDGVIDDTPGDGAYGNDALGFGEFEGKFGMAVFSQHPIDHDSARTFQRFLWRDMPGALLPDDPATPAAADYYTSDELDVLPLSSKSHWDLPILVGPRTVHFLVSHPTPPVFDGVEDRNGRRNHDEIRFWADYVQGGGQAAYITDDAGGSGGLARGAKFVIAGDQNSDPFDGDSIPGSIQQLLESSRVDARTAPASAGGTYWADAQNVLNDGHAGDPALDTADFCDTPAFPPCSGPGNLRVDYVLPSRGLRTVDAGIFWPTGDDPLVYLTGTGFPVPSSDHRLVWVDVQVGGG